MYEPKKIPNIPEGYQEPIGMMNRQREDKRDNIYRKISNYLIRGLATLVTLAAILSPTNSTESTDISAINYEPLYRPNSIIKYDGGERQASLDSLAIAEEQKWRTFQEKQYKDWEKQCELNSQ